MSEHSDDNMTKGNPVYLTPFIRNGLIQQGQQACQVSSIPYLECDLDLDNWSGYISVGPNSSCHLFFWYFLCKGGKNALDSSEKGATPPLVVWLNGGPGLSSMVGLFEEIGPLQSHSNGTVTLRDVAWTDHFDVLFIDNPMETGFSYSDTGEKTRSVKEAAENLYEFTVQFYQVFPNTKCKDLYIGGQSYGGKYVPEFAARVKEDNSINLKGVFIGSGLYDPCLMIPLFPDYLVAVGMLSEVKAMEMRLGMLHTLEEHKTNPEKAVMDLLDWVFNQSNKSLGFTGTENILYTTKSRPWSLESYLNQPSVQQVIHVKPIQFVVLNTKVILGMAEDFPRGVQDALGSLLKSSVKVLVFNGQMDPLTTVGMTENFLSSVLWPGREKYRAADKVVWRDNMGEVAGYATQADNFTRVVIRNAGHRTAIDQPPWVLDMMQRFVQDLSFNSPSN